ncbi:MAG TPA: hypothetical protein VGK67_33895 [Myxococcales bacterium]|jgi:hypothetical protein
MSQDKDGRSPQQRAAEHLKKILRNAAVGGAALGLSSGCGSCGPTVCDPLPPPICDNSPTTATFLNGGYATAEATWVARDAGGLMVHVSLGLNGMGANLDFAADPAVSGASVVAVQRDATAVTIDFVPDAGASRIEVVVQLACESKPEALKLAFDVSKPQAGSAVAVSSLE